MTGDGLVGTRLDPWVTVGHSDLAQIPVPRDREVNFEVDFFHLGQVPIFHFPTAVTSATSVATVYELFGRTLRSVPTGATFAVDDIRGAIHHRTNTGESANHDPPNTNPQVYVARFVMQARED